MVRDSLIELMQDALDRGLATSPPVELLNAIHGDDEAAALWEELCSLEEALPQALALELPAPSLRAGVMSTIREERTNHAASVVSIAPTRSPMPLSAVAAAILVLVLSGALFISDRQQHPAAPAPPSEQPPALVADAALDAPPAGPAALRRIELPELRFAAPMQHSRATLAETGRGLKGTADIIFRQTAGVVAVFGDAPTNFMREAFPSFDP